MSHMVVPGRAPENNSRLFGTSGVRGGVGQDLTLDLCRGVACAVGTTLAPHSKVCVATDTRLSRETVKDAAVSGLRSSGIDVVDLGILPTPALAHLTREMGFDSGVMITASHNPPEFNGIKLFNRDTTGYSREQETEIERIFAEKKFRSTPTGAFSRSGEAKERYFQCIRERFPRAYSNGSLRVVVDPGNGAASGFASELFSAAGLEVIPFNDEPDGSFPGRDPEPRGDTLQGTIEFLRQRGADLAICFDGDADRVVFCDREGFLGFDELISFVSRMAVEESGKKKVVTTVETGRLLDITLEDLGVEVMRGRVGDVSVAHLARELDAAIGVEPVGVYIMPEIGYYPDSMFATLTLLRRIKRAGDIRDFFKSIPPLFSGKKKLSCPNHLKAAVIENLTGDSSLFGACELNTLDGLRFELDNSWALIRASGTEPAIRVSAESASRAQTEALLSRGVRAIKNVLERVTL